MSINPLSGGTNLYLQQLMALERRQLQSLQANRSALEAKKSVFTDLSSKLSALRTLADQLAGGRQTSPLYAFSAESTDDDRVSVTSTSGAEGGSYSLKVTGIAHRHVLGSSEIDLDASTFSEGTYRFGITVDGEETQVEVTVDAGETNEEVLGKIASAINSSGVAASAHLVTTGSGLGRLVVRSEETGVEHLISEIRDTSGNLMQTLALTGTSSPGSYSSATTQEASDAAIELDGLILQSSSNTFENAVPGVTLTVHGTTEQDVEITISVSADEESIKKTIENFVSNYNAALAEVRKQVSGDLRGQPLVQRLSLSLRQAVARRVGPVGSGELSTLAEIGLTINRDGSLTFTNPSKLKEKLGEKVEEVAQLFNATDGIATRIDEIVDEFLGGAGPLSLLRRQADDKIRRLDTRIDREKTRLALREDFLRRDLAKIQDLISAVGIQQQLAQGLVGF
jgi:flagellar hook-associated protein 2